MQIEKLNFEETHQFSGLFLDYLNKSKQLENFYSLPPTKESFKIKIEERNYNDSFRSTLHSSLMRQYRGFEIKEAVQKNLDSLQETRTFTITTGHQLNLCSGPLYFIYKIISAINACKQLKNLHPDYHFVPVYWMASEDHDFAEINHFNLFGKNYQWDSDQSGAVGKFKLNGLSEVLSEMPEKVELFEKAYSSGRNLSEATRYFVNELFGAEGLVILDADDADLKRLFSHVIEDDLLNHHANDQVEHYSEKLNELGYKAQVFPRTINLFYMHEGIRERLILEDGNYQVNNQSIKFNREEILKMVDEHPDRFSPNVILRPLYQEIILPNLAYIGGPGELAYWLQLKGVFDQYNTTFPILLPRNHALFINKGIQKKINKLELDTKEIFLDFNTLKENYLQVNSENHHKLGKQKGQIIQVFKEIEEKAQLIDPSLKGFVAAEGQKTMKSLENIEKRLKKAEESRSETSLSQIRGILDKLFPNNAPQERMENFLNFYINNPSFISVLLDNFDPFDLHYLVMIDE